MITLGLIAMPLALLIAFTIYYIATEPKAQNISVMPKFA